MQEPISYSLDHATSTVNLSLTADRLIINTAGKGLADRPRTLEIPLSDLQKFAVVPTIAAQNVVARQAGENVYDAAYDSEFIVSYNTAGKTTHKRVFVNNQ